MSNIEVSIAGCMVLPALCYWACHWERAEFDPYRIDTPQLIPMPENVLQVIMSVTPVSVTNFVQRPSSRLF